jgi:hypothetical protein
MKINPQLIEWLRLEMSGSNPLTLTNQHANTYVMLLRECCDAKLIELAHIDNDKIAIRYRLTTVGEYWIDPANDTISEPAAREPQAETIGDMLESAILGVLVDSEPCADFDIRSLLLENYPDLHDYSIDVVRAAINRLNKADKIVFRNDQWLNKLYFIPPQPATSTPVSDSGAYTVHEFERAIPGAFPSHEIRNPQGDWVLYADEYRAPIIADAFNTETASLTAQLAVANSERDAMKARVAELEAENAVLGIVISSVGIKVHDARDLLFDEKYAAADGELKNAEVIIRANRGNDATD